jgi:hypothetical protein
VKPRVGERTTRRRRGRRSLPPRRRCRAPGHGSKTINSRGGETIRMCTFEYKTSALQPMGEPWRVRHKGGCMGARRAEGAGAGDWGGGGGGGDTRVGTAGPPHSRIGLATAGLPFPLPACTAHQSSTPKGSWGWGWHNHHGFPKMVLGNQFRDAPRENQQPFDTAHSTYLYSPFDSPPADAPPPR